MNLAVKRPSVKTDSTFEREWLVEILTKPKKYKPQYNQTGIVIGPANKDGKYPVEHQPGIGQGYYAPNELRRIDKLPPTKSRHGFLLNMPKRKVGLNRYRGRGKTETLIACTESSTQP